MNQEIEYAEMLEIPVSTVNVVRKKRRKKEPALRAVPQQSITLPTPQIALPAPTQPLKDSVIAQVNERVGEEEINTPTPASQNEVSQIEEESVTEGALRFDPIPERIDTVRLYGEDELRDFQRKGMQNEDEYRADNENERTMYALNSKNQPSKAVKIALGVEFAAACVLCGAIFFTNVFMPGSAINTFFRGVTNTEKTDTVNSRVYSDFELSPIVSDFSNVTLTLSDTGVLSFTDECCVYPAADGEVAEISKSEEGEYMMKIRYSNTFTGVFCGLDQVFYAEGDKVKSNVPVGFSNGDAEVQMMMYSSDQLLNCFRLTEENDLVWVTEE